MKILLFSLGILQRSYLLQITIENTPSYQANIESNI